MAHGTGGVKAKHRLGSTEWERAGGPPLTFSQRVGLLSGAGVLVAGDLGARLWWLVSRHLRIPSRWPEKVNLEAWAPPDTRAAREAEAYLREVSTLPMVYHCLRTYYFSAILYEGSGVKQSVDREALYVAALLHDVGLFQVSMPPGEHCFSVGSARRGPAHRRMRRMG